MTLVGPWYDAMIWAALLLPFGMRHQNLHWGMVRFDINIGFRWARFAVPFLSSILPVSGADFPCLWHIPPLHIGDAPHINVVLMGV